MEGQQFAGFPVSDVERAAAWFTRLYGVPESFRAHETEYVWLLNEHCAVYVLLKPESAGHGLVTTMLPGREELDAFAAAAAGRGVEPTSREEYDGGVVKLVYRDPDDNEVGFGAAPADSTS